MGGTSWWARILGPGDRIDAAVVTQVDGILGSLFAEFGDVDAAVRRWRALDPADQFFYVRTWIENEPTIVELRGYARGGKLTAAQRERYDELKSLRQLIGSFRWGTVEHPPALESLE